MLAYETFPIQKLQWEVGYCKGLSDTPDVFIPATVPGAVQLDWAQAHGWDSYLFGDNSAQYGWTEDVYWVYRSRLEDLPTVGSGERLFLICGGVDYQFEVRLGGSVIHAQEGMFTPFEIDLTNKVRIGDFLEIMVFPAPKSVPAPNERVQVNQSCKPGVSYGWDFHPRLIPLGIWGECGWQIRPANYIAYFETSYELALDLSRAKITVELELHLLGPIAIQWTFKDPDGQVIIDRSLDGKQGASPINESLEKPVLWWPNGQGHPALYESELALRNETGEVLQIFRQKVGFRRARLVMHPNAWVEPVAYPKSRSTPPIMLEINGRAIFGKGSNWVSPHIFPGMVTEEVCRDLLLLVKNANMNMLRCWGGAIVQKDDFFRLCDELGIMVWQEFPLACNRYEGTPEYLKMLDQESRTIIRSLRRHPSLVLWCGGNELFNAWSAMTEQDLAIRLLNRNCFDLDPGRPFLATAPLMGMAHGSYSFKGPDGKEVYERFINSRYTAYTEFGVVAHGPVEFIQRYLPLHDQQPDLAPEEYQTERAREGWSEERTHFAKYYFGALTTMEQVVETSQFLQGEGLKFIFEEARRQKPSCSMALNWCLNEPWPAISNCAIISWPVIPRPAYYEVVKACRTVLASIRVPKFWWEPGELFEGELWLLNDGPEPVPAGRIEARLEFGTESVFLLSWDHPGVPVNTNLLGPTIHYRLPEIEAARERGERMKVVLEYVDHHEYDSEYVFLFSKKQGRGWGVF